MANSKGPKAPLGERIISHRRARAVTEADDLLRRFVVIPEMREWEREIRRVRGLLAEWRKPEVEKQ